MEKCDVGVLLNEQCHLNSYSSKKIGVSYNLSTFDSQNLLLLKYRIENFFEVSGGCICDYHKCKYLDYFSVSKRKCCDPFKKHKSVVNADRIIGIHKCQDSLNLLLLKLIPGNKLCRTCEQLLNKFLDEEKTKKQETEIENNYNLRKIKKEDGQMSEWETLSQQSVLTNNSVESEGTDISEYISSSQEKKFVQKLLEDLNMKPFDVYKQSREKIQITITNILGEIFMKLSEKFSIAYEVNIPNFNIVSQNIFEDSTALNEIIMSLQQSVSKAPTITDKLQYLKLLPQNWKRPTISRYFKCSDYVYKELEKCRRNSGNLEFRQRKVYSKISQAMVASIKDYYVSDSNCYTCPGKRQCISIRGESGQRIYLQKKILLHTLHDLYNNFIDDYSGEEILPKFSFFAFLKPKECKHPGDPGSHRICVCQQHENVKLKLTAVTNTIKYRDFFEIAVCSTDNINCMLHRCSKCPGLEAIKRAVKEFNIDWPEEQVNYKYWVDEGSRASLESLTERVEPFRDHLSEDIWELTKHHFIANSQNSYLEYCKNILHKDTCIIIMDFSENYSFIIQDSVQGFYYNNSQATVHPLVIYFKTEDDDKLQLRSFCIISDTKDHFAYTVHAFMKKMMDVIKDEFKWIKNVIYFSDGAPTQYKNKNHLVNIYLHENDFNIKVKSCNFFATSHGKTSCDAIGGIVKRATMRYCLRSSPENQISTPWAMYQFLSREDMKIRVLWVPDTDVQKHRRKLNSRFTAVKAIRNTRLHHCYIPIQGNAFEMRITSLDSSKTVFEMNILSQKL